MTKCNLQKGSNYAGHCFISVKFIYFRDLRSIGTFHQKFAAKYTSAKTSNSCECQCYLALAGNVSAYQNWRNVPALGWNSFFLCSKALWFLICHSTMNSAAEYMDPEVKFTESPIFLVFFISFWKYSEFCCLCYFWFHTGNGVMLINSKFNVAILWNRN